MLVKPVKRVNFVYAVDKGFALCFVISRHFRNQHGGVYAVLVADVSPRKISVTFLESQNVTVFFPFLFQLAYNVADVLESRKHVLDFRAVGGGDFTHQFRSDDGLYDNGING